MFQIISSTYHFLDCFLFFSLFKVFTIRTCLYLGRSNVLERSRCIVFCITRDISMKLKNKIIALGVSALMLIGAGASLTFQNSSINKVEKAEAVTEDGYTVYFSNELGFATRDSGDNRIVGGDMDGNVNTRGNVLATKCELRFTYKNVFSSYWIGVGGYAVYHSSATNVRFLYLTRNESGAYSRGGEKTGLVMKTEDGNTDLSTVMTNYFSDYVDAVYRYDFTNPSAVKFEFYVKYNGVTYYPYEGSTKLGTVTYTHTPVGFDSEDTQRVMAGANAGAQSGSLNLLKFKTNDVHLDDIIQTPTAVFDYSYIDNFFFTFNLTEKIYANKGYFNDHLSDGTYTNRDGNNINIGDGIIINGQTFNYWRSYTPANVSYPRNDGVMAFPLNAGSNFNPVAIEVHTQSIEFKVNLEEIPMDGIVVTFKAGIFEGYNADTGITYILEKDLTFYSTISTSNSPSRIVFSKTQTWETTSLGFRGLNDNGEHTATQGGKYHRWMMWTNIPFDTSKSLIKQACPADNYRYMYDNLLMNGKPITYYNAWVRGNSKDFTDLSDVSTQNPDYELSHPTGSADKKYDLGIRIEVILDQPVYAFQFSVPNQLVTDLSLGTLTFSLRDGSDWLTKRGDDTVILRYSASANAADTLAVETFANGSLHMSDYNENLGYCKDNEHHYYLTAKAAFNDLTDNQKMAFEHNAEFANAKARYQAWAAINNDAAPFDGNDTVVTPINGNNFVTALTAIGGDYTAIVIILMFAISSITVLMFLSYKKRKER